MLLIKFYGYIKTITGRAKVSIDCEENWNIRDLIYFLGEEYGQEVPGFIMDNSTLSEQVNVFVNSRSIIDLDNEETLLDNDSVVVFIPRIAGG